jgi:hypothetical protein
MAADKSHKETEKNELVKKIKGQIRELDFFEKINVIDFRIDSANYFSELTGLETDIIVLSSAKPLLKFQVLKYRKLIYI